MRTRQESAQRPYAFPEKLPATPVHGSRDALHRRRRDLRAAWGPRLGRPRCSNPGQDTGVLHRSGHFFPSTAWGSKSCPYCFHRHARPSVIRPAQGPGDLWSTMIHRLWTSFPSTACGPRCPPAAHRPAGVFPSRSGLLHTAVHCSATRHPPSPPRVKGVTPRGAVGLWGTRVKLGTDLGRNPPVLCTGCAQLSGVHRIPGLSTEPPTGPVDKKRALTCANSVIHRFHRPYYYYPS